MTNNELQKLSLENRLNLLSGRNKENYNIIQKILRKLRKLNG